MYEDIDKGRITLSVKEPNTFNIIGIDPGTVNLGVAIFNIDSKTLKIKSIDTFNIRVKGKVLLDDRIFYMGDTLFNLMNRYKPNMVAIETPFVSLRRITAVIPLARLFQQILMSVKRSSRCNDMTMETLAVVPTEAKKTAGCGRNNKDGMREMLIKDKHLVSLLNNKVSDLSEHEIDSIWIGLTAYNKMIKEKKNEKKKEKK